MYLVTRYGPFRVCYFLFSLYKTKNASLQKYVVNFYNYNLWLYSSLLHLQSISNSVHGKVYSLQHYVIKFVSGLRQVSGILPVLRACFLHHYNWLPWYNWNIENDVKHKNTSNPGFNFYELSWDINTKTFFHLNIYLHYIYIILHSFWKLIICKVSS